MTAKVLDVPYYSQEDPGARWGNNDCGIACVYMVIQYHYTVVLGQNPASTGIDALARRILPSPTAFAKTIHLVNAGALYKVDLDSTDYRFTDQRLTVPRMIEEINAGRPSISLIGYGDVPHRQNQKYRGGHYVTVVGYDDEAQMIVVNDPDFFGDRRIEGWRFKIPYDVMDKAIAPHPPWFSFGSQGVFYKGAL